MTHNEKMVLLFAGLVAVLLVTVAAVSGFEKGYVSAVALTLWLLAVVSVFAVVTRYLVMRLAGLRRRWQESEQLYRAVVEQLVEGIALADPRTMSFLEANRAFRCLLGYSAEEIVKLRVYDVVNHDQAAIDEKTRQILDEDFRFAGERWFRRKDGSLVNMEVSVSRVTHRGRDVFCAVVREISERKQSEEGEKTESALRESEERSIAT